MIQSRLTTALFLSAMLVMGHTAYAKKAGAKDTLYKKLGGKKAITAVVNEFVSNCATDSRVNSFFAATAKSPKRMAAFKKHLVDQICEASGGPCHYTGKDMKDAHAGMGISEANFTAVVEDLTKALDKFKVAAADKNTLLGVLGGMKGDIVEAKSASADMPAQTKPE